MLCGRFGYSGSWLLIQQLDLGDEEQYGCDLDGTIRLKSKVTEDALGQKNAQPRLLNTMIRLLIKRIPRNQLRYFQSVLFL